MHSQTREEGAGNFVRGGALQVGAGLEYGARPANGKDIRESAAAAAKVLEDRVGEVGHHGAIGRRSHELHQLLRILYRQRPKQHDIHHAEQGGIGSDAQSERNHRHDTEHRRFRQRAGGVTQVLPEGFEGGEGPQLAASFADARGVSELACGRRMGCGIAAILLGAHSQVKRQFLVQIAIQPAAMDQRHEP